MRGCRRHARLAAVIIVACAALAGCNRPDGQRAAAPVDRKTLRLAVTTSTQDSGLLDELLPMFEQEAAARVDVIAVGSGQAMKLAEQGDVDALVVHDRAAEEAFMAAGHGALREK